MRLERRRRVGEIDLKNEVWIGKLYGGRTARESPYWARGWWKKSARSKGGIAGCIQASDVAFGNR